jgi:nucleoside-diphosphate-sugar epimerase
MGERILVTGASGLIGSHLVNKLKQEHRVVSLVHDDVPSRWLDEALDGTVKVRGDVRDFGLIRRVINQYGVSELFHFAARANVKQAYKDPVNVYETNVMGIVSVLEACRQLDVKKTLVLITDKVYGEKVDATEDDPLQPSEPYATSKIAQQQIAESYAKTYGMDVITPHSCNVFGLDLHSNRIFPNVIKSCLRGEQPIIFANDHSIREYIYVDDLVDALRTMVYTEGFPKYKGTYNISTGWVYDNEQIVLKVLEHFSSLKPKYVDGDLPPQIQRQTMKSVRWSWRPGWSFDDSVARTIADFEKYREDWK